jgi:ribonuclease T1
MELTRKSALFFILSLLFFVPLAHAHGHHHAHDSGAIQTVAEADLPPEALETLALIKKGGPFPYARDGVVFSNREHQLSSQTRGYYHEYTVKTPGERTRGPQRIVCGPWPECYYTADHYRTFKRITGER